MTRNQPRERGAAAVEFALLVPVLLFIVFVLVDLGWVFNQQLAVTSASREAVRYYAIHHEDSDAVTEAERRGRELIPQPVSVSFDWDPCTSGPDSEAAVIVTKPLTDLTGFVSALAPSATLSATGTMRCGG